MWGAAGPSTSLIAWISAAFLMGRRGLERKLENGRNTGRGDWKSYEMEGVLRGKEVSESQNTCGKAMNTC